MSLFSEGYDEENANCGIGKDRGRKGANREGVGEGPKSLPHMALGYIACNTIVSASD